MNQVKVTRGFQVTLPKEVCEALSIQIGDYLSVYVEGSRIIMEKVIKRRKTLKSGRMLSPDEIDALIERGLREALVGGRD
ncbi:MAG: AbrB/MazE/SpoVT family DNA-binding domain-containing protein [Candidatus Methanodesulfokora sp.]|jgi:AbrB family looped-hinge helix DNA binding protein